MGFPILPSFFMVVGNIHGLLSRAVSMKACVLRLWKIPFECVGRWASGDRQTENESSSQPWSIMVPRLGVQKPFLLSSPEDKWEL